MKFKKKAPYVRPKFFVGQTVRISDSPAVNSEFRGVTVSVASVGTSTLGVILPNGNPVWGNIGFLSQFKFKFN